MRLSIDTDRCVGHGRCFSLAPQLFDSDELGNGFVTIEGDVPADLVDAARLAEANCPEHAVQITE